MNGPVYTYADCSECHRRFDLTDIGDAQEWFYGHDCEDPEPEPDPDEWRKARLEDAAAAELGRVWPGLQGDRPPE